MSTVKDYLFGDKLLSLIKYAFDNKVTMRYIFRYNQTLSDDSSESERYSDMFHLVTDLLDNNENVTGQMLLDEVQRITPYMIVSPDGEFDMKYRMISAYILVSGDEIDNDEFTQYVSEVFERFSDTLAKGLNEGGFWEYSMHEGNNGIELLYNDIDNALNMLINGYQAEWRDRLLRLGESADPQEVQDYINKFGQSYDKEIIPGYYNDIDRLPRYSEPSYSSVVYTAPSVLRTEETGGIENGYRIFNSTEVSDQIPMIIYTVDEDEKYYKIQKDFRVTEDINKMLLKPFESISEIIDKGEKLVERTTGRGRAKIIEKVVTSHNDENTIQYIYRYQDNFINVILYLSNMKVEISLYSGELTEDIPGIMRVQDVRPMNITGKFDIYGDHLPPFVSEDIMLTNSVLNRMFDLYETTNISVEYDRLSSVYRYPYQEDLARVGLSDKVPTTVRFYIENSYVVTAETDDQGNRVPVGTAKTIVRFSGVSDKETLDRFLLFMRLFSIYSSNAQYQIFEEYYNAVGQSYPAYTRITTLDNKSVLQASRPDIFIDGYSTVCQTQRQPTVIDEDQYNSLTEEQKEMTMKFPYTEDPDEIQLILMCPEDHPYPNILNNRLSNKSEFPVLPCCQKSNTAVRRDNIEYYNEFGQRLPRGQGTQTILRTMRILSPGVESEITRSNAIGLFRRIGHENGIILKIGVTQDNQSFLHSCSYLLDDTIDRQDILEDQWNIPLVAQECYDDDNPRETIKNRENSIDSRYYRIIEEMFNINIFFLRNHRNNIEFHNPRHIPPYIRAYRNRRCIFIMETEESGVLRYEPVVYQNGSELIKIFDNPSVIYDLYIKTVGVYTGDSPYITVDPKDAVGQIIDKNGKMRGLVYSDHSVITDPLQPLDLPLSRSRIKLRRTEDLTIPPYNVEITGYSRYPYGLWFTMKYEETEITGFTLASQEIPNVYPEIFKSVPILNESPNFNEIDWIYTYPNRISELNVILDVIYHIFYRFGEEVLYVGNDTEYQYDIERIPQILDEEYLSNILSNVQRDSNIVQEIDGNLKVYLYNRRFADGVIYQMKFLRNGNYIPKHRLHIPPIVRSENSLILSGDREYTKYLDFMSYGRVQHDMIPLEYNNIFPYIYKVNDLLFLIQPVSTKDGLGEKRATYVSHEWRNTGINHGYFPNDTLVKDSTYKPVDTVVYLNQIFNIYADYFTFNGKYYSILPLHTIDENVFEELRQTTISPEREEVRTRTVVKTTTGTRGRSTGTRGGTRIRTTRRPRGRPRLETKVVWAPN